MTQPKTQQIRANWSKYKKIPQNPKMTGEQAGQAFIADFCYFNIKSGSLYSVEEQQMILAKMKTVDVLSRRIYIYISSFADVLQKLVYTAGFFQEGATLKLWMAIQRVEKNRKKSEVQQLIKDARFRLVKRYIAIRFMKILAKVSSVKEVDLLINSMFADDANLQELTEKIDEYAKIETINGNSYKDLELEINKIIENQGIEAKTLKLFSNIDGYLKSMNYDPFTQFAPVIWGIFAKFDAQILSEIKR